MLLQSSVYKLEASGCSETLATLYQTTRYHIPKKKEYSHLKQILIGCNYSAGIEEYQIGATCGTHERDEKRIQDFSKRTWHEGLVNLNVDGDNINMDIKDQLVIM
jgi:hypothetical protein